MPRSFSWPFLGRVLLKALLLFVVFNLVFAALYPMGALGRISFYNLLFPGRERFPFGENPQQSYNLSLYNLDAMFASLALNAAPSCRQMSTACWWSAILRCGAPCCAPRIPCRGGLTPWG